MAITRAQQARQMYKKGSKPVEQAGVMNYMPSEMVTVPKIAKSSPDTPTAKLAYITPKEQDILIDLNLYGSLNGKPNRGPGGIPSLEGDFGPGGKGSYSEAGTGRDVSVDKEGRTVIGGDVNQGVDVRKARSEAAAKAKAEAEAKEKRKTIRERINKGLTNLRNRNIKKFIDRSIRKDLYRSGFVPNAFMGIKVPTTLGIASETGYSLFGPEVDLFDEDSKREIASTLTTTGGSLTKSQSKALESFGKNIANRDELLEKGMTQERFEELYPKPIVDDRDGPQDPCLGPNPPAYCFTGIRSAAPVVEDTGYINPLSKLTPRIAGTRFLGTELENEDEDKSFDLRLAKGGRVGLFKGAQADTAKGKAMSPGTTASGGFRGGGGDGPKEPPSVINPPPKEPVLKTRNILKGYNQHNINNQKLKNAVTLGLISNDEYNVLGGYDVNQTMGLDPFMTGVTSGLYNVYQTIKGDQPASEIFGDVKRNVEGSFGLPEELKTKYDNIMAMSSQEMTDQLADQKIAQMADGGIASLDDMDREAFVLGGITKGLKKAVRGIKKLAKSPIGKAALGFAAFQYGPGLLAGKTLPPSMGFKSKGLFDIIKANPMESIFAASALAGAMTPKEDKDKFDIDSYYASGQTGDAEPFARIAGSKFDFYGGRIASAEGGSTEEKEPVAKKTMPLLDMDGMEKDYREDGGFVPIGRMEKADDVPARLSKNEFVFTADAVRNAGDGDVDKGAEVMYNMMKNLEAGGEVSEESQGLDGAREMFQTSQRLGEVI